MRDEDSALLLAGGCPWGRPAPEVRALLTSPGETKELVSFPFVLQRPKPVFVIKHPCTCRQPFPQGRKLPNTWWLSRVQHLMRTGLPCFCEYAFELVVGRYLRA